MRSIPRPSSTRHLHSDRPEEEMVLSPVACDCEWGDVKDGAAAVPEPVTDGGPDASAGANADAEGAAVAGNTALPPRLPDVGWYEGAPVNDEAGNGLPEPALAWLPASGVPVVVSDCAEAGSKSTSKAG